MFKAIFLSREQEQFRAVLRDVSDAELVAGTPEADVTVAVEYSTINYKDALALTDRSPVVRRWPMIPGIDAAGTVIASDHPAWKAGDRAIINGWGAGESQFGGLAQRARFKGDCLVRVPDGMSPRQAMSIGTAGFTAMLCCLALRDQGVEPGAGEILVTGATGGVGSIAILILTRWGYRVVASTGKLAEAEYLRSLGAAEIMDRDLLAVPGKPLQKERWAGVVDTVGSHTLVNACAQTRFEGTVTACGLAQGMDFPATVAPFILRGVKLIGIISVMCPQARRERAWNALAQDVDRSRLEGLVREVPLGESFDVAREILAGKVRGRVVIDVNC